MGGGEVVVGRERERACVRVGCLLALLLALLLLYLRVARKGIKAVEHNEGEQPDAPHVYRLVVTL